MHMRTETQTTTARAYHTHTHIQNITQLANSHNNKHNNKKLPKLSSAVVIAKIVTSKTRSNRVAAMPSHIPHVDFDYSF